MRETLVIIPLLVILCAPWLSAQETAQPERPAPTDSSVIGKNGASSVQEELRDLEMEVALLRQKVGTISAMITLLIGILGVVLAVGGVTSLFGWFRSERRTQEVHHTFLQGSKDTLDLVNATLTLAKEASERAAKFIETKARSTLRDLDRKARELLASGPKRLVSDPVLRSHLHTLAQKIAAFEINLFTLQSELQLTPHCLFVRGMDFHLNQQFDDALEYWKSAALDEHAADELKSLSWYWIGCENNNLGRFADARSSFENALAGTTGSQWYELQRILIESRFFEKKRRDDLIAALEGLLASIESEASTQELNEVRTNIITTLGNIRFQLGNELERKGDTIKATENWKSAKESFRSIPGESSWALFGLAEAYHKLDESPEAESIFVRIRPGFSNEYIKKEEPRAKLLAKTGEFICCLRVSTGADETLVMYSQVLEALGRVDEQLTVYSLMQRRNVSKGEFKQDLDELMAQLRRRSN